MRNLRLVSEAQYQLSPGSLDSAPISWMSAGMSTIMCCSSERFITFSEDTKETNEQAVPPEHFHIAGTEFLVAENAVFLATAEGSLLICWGAEMSIVGHVPAGISAVKWSPEQEILVITTKPEHDSGHLLLMTSDWTVIVTEPLNPDDFGEMKPVNVGWGKKETQFHGSEGKEAAKTKTQVALTISAADDLQPRISWRGDGQYFAVSSVNPATMTRVIRIYERQGILQGTSELVDGLEWSLAWKPSGALIASTARTTRKQEVVFFEKNGLRHGGFDLRFLPGTFTVKELQWNMSSEVLLLWFVLNEREGGLVDCLQLWTIGNYHWYLKQSLRFPRDQPSSVTACLWSLRDPFVLYLADHSGKLTVVEWIWDTCRSTDVSSTVAVIDGSKVLLTAFAHSVVPPPSSTHALAFDASINQVHFQSSTPSSYQLAVVTDRKVLAIFTSDSENPSAAPTLRKTCDLPFSQFACLFWAGREHLAAVEFARINEVDVWGLWTFSVHHESQRELESLSSMEQLEQDKTCKLISYFDSPIYDFVPCDKVSLIFLKNGQVIRTTRQPSTSDASPLTKIPPNCDTISVDEKSSPAPVIFSLNTNNHKLFRNGALVSDSCTSFILTEEFLVYTTHSHKIVCVKLNGEKFGELTDDRQVERGSRLVTVVSREGRTEVVLQLPRGNLEVIHPRSLVIERIAKLVTEKKYREVFELMRKHRINMNLMVDFDVKRFLNDIPVVLSQINDAANLNIFIAELSDENVTTTVYKNHFVKPTESVEDKANVVLRNLAEALGEMPENGLFLSTLACHIYKKPQELEEALFKIKNLMSSSKISEAEEALKFVLYSANVDELYNVALGTYDFDLVLMVAAKSRKDPKEYVPFLNQFRAIQPEAYRYFVIDNHLKRYKKALGHLASLGAEKFPECVELVEKHALYKEALDIFQKQSPERNKLLGLYGEYLAKTKRRYLEAALAFEEGGFFTKTVENYRKVHEWKLGMACAGRANWEEAAVGKAAEMFALSLKAAGRHAEAAEILLKYLPNGGSAWQYLIDGHLWEDALLLRPSEEGQYKLKAALDKQAEVLLTQISASGADLEKYKERLKVVRQLRKEKKVDGSGDDFIDNMSEASSVSERTGTSRTSRTSTSRMTSKNKRKDEKKKRSLREGGPYEDLALLDTLKNIYRQVEAMTDEAGRLLKFLLKFRSMELGKELQSSVGQLLVDCDRKKNEIWTAEDLAVQVQGRAGGMTFGPNATVSSIVSDFGAGQGKEVDLGGLTLHDLALFVPPDFQALSKWNELTFDNFER